jgi:hypothetical protein
MLAAVPALALLYGVGCGGSEKAPEPETTAAAQEPAPPPVVPARVPEPQEQKPVKIEAAPGDWEKIAQELAKGRTVQDQERISASYKHFDLALAYQRKGDFDKAKVEARRAVELWHENA